MHGDGLMGMSLAVIDILLAAIHSFDVIEIVVLQLLPLQFECICHQTCFRGPRLWTQMDHDWYFKTLQFSWNDKKKI